MIAATCLAVFVVLAGLGVGCSSADDAIQGATAEAVEAGLNNVLTDTVDPLVSFLGAIPTIVGGGAPRSSFGGGVTCPDTGSVCSGGSVTCTPSGGGLSLTFDFDQCVVATGDLPFTLDGGLVATPGATIALTFNNLFINSSAAMNGTGSVNVGTCSYAANVSTNDPTSVVGTIIKCDADTYPTTASHLDISFDAFLIAIDFDGSATATAVASKSGNAVANCSINLAAEPLSSSCEAP